jgi:hypothetical protein
MAVGLRLLVVTCFIVMHSVATDVRCKTCRGPVHSWKTIPVAIHTADVKTGPTGRFSSMDLETLVRFPLVTIEK